MRRVRTRKAKGMTANEVASALEPMLTEMEARMSKDLSEQVSRQIEAHRRAVWVRDEWCCKEMTAFAQHFWCAPRPKREYEFGTTFAIRGKVVNYCPFCGVFVGARTEP